MNKQTIESFRVDFQNAMKTLEEKYNMKIQAKTITYSSDQLSFKVESKLLNENGEVSIGDINKQQMQLVASTTYNYGKIDFEKSFTLSNGKTVKVIEFKTRARKAPIIVKAESGEMYCLGWNQYLFYTKETV